MQDCNKIAVVIYLTFHFISNSIIRLENENKLCLLISHQTFGNHRTLVFNSQFSQ